MKSMLSSCNISQSLRFAGPGWGDSSAGTALSHTSVRSKPAWSTDPFWYSSHKSNYKKYLRPHLSVRAHYALYIENIYRVYSVNQYIRLVVSQLLINFSLVFDLFSLGMSSCHRITCIFTVWDFTMQTMLFRKAYYPDLMAHSYDIIWSNYCHILIMVYPSFSLFEEKNYKPNLDLNKAKVMVSQIKNQVLISDIWANDFSIGKISQISNSATHWWYRRHATPTPFCCKSGNQQFQIQRSILYELIS